MPFRSEKGGFYEGGVIATEQLTTPRSRCTTISVSDVRDPDSRPPDSCAYFRIGFWPNSGVDWPTTYTDKVIACGSHRTVLARNVPNNVRYHVVYDIKDMDPDTGKITGVTFRIWH